MLSASEKLAQALSCLYSVQPTKDTRIVLWSLWQGLSLKIFPSQESALMALTYSLMIVV